MFNDLQVVMTNISAYKQLTVTTAGSWTNCYCSVSQNHPENPTPCNDQVGPSVEERLMEPLLMQGGKYLCIAVTTSKIANILCTCRK